MSHDRIETGTQRRILGPLSWMGTVLVVVSLAGGCATWERMGQSPGTERDKTKKGAVIGAAAGAVLGKVLGEGDADEVLAGAAIGAGIGAGVGAYMDKQERDLSRIEGAEVERVDEDMLRVDFESDVLFGFDSSTLTAQSSDTLRQVVGVLNQYDQTAIIVQGHTDSTGRDDYNMRLSERRADAVKAFLTRNGISQQRIIAIGYGEAHPVASNDTPDGRVLNRRVDLLIKAKS